MHELNMTDWGILIGMGLSILLGVLRGFAKEAMSLITWIAAITLSALYTEKVSLWFSGISIVGARLMLAFVLIVLTTLIIGGIISHLIGKLISNAKFNLPDRLMGSFFGCGRGLLVIAILILFLGPTQLAQRPFWKDSQLIPELMPLTHWLKEKLPENLLPTPSMPHHIPTNTTPENGHENILKNMPIHPDAE